MATRTFYRIKVAQGLKKVLSGRRGQVDFMLEQATFFNHLPARQTLTHSKKHE